MKILKKVAAPSAQNYCSIYQDLPKEETNLVAHWLPDKTGKLVCFWVREPRK